MIIGVGSPSAAKVYAVELAFSELGLPIPAVRGYDIKTAFTQGQIWTTRDRFLGAALRSVGVLEGPDRVDFTVGVESGLYVLNQAISAFHYATDVVIVDCRKKTWCSATTQSIPVPLELIGELGRGPTANADAEPTDIGRLIRGKNGGVSGDAKDVVAYLTNSRDTRAGLVARAITTLLRVVRGAEVTLRCPMPLETLTEALRA